MTAQQFKRIAAKIGTFFICMCILSLFVSLTTASIYWATGVYALWVVFDTLTSD